tara:strand:+ start:764 stop:1510 length:747 start_codon:yes stop_codon:yes gene_type:complete
MAIFGDFGKIFLGGATTKQAVTAGSIALGVDPVKAAGLGSIAGKSAETLSAINRSQQGQAVAVGQATQTNPQETQASGTITNVNLSPFFQPASFGNLPRPPATQQSGFQTANLPALFMGGGALLSGAAAVIDLFFVDPITGETKRKKITRRFKAQVKQSVMLIGLEETAKMLNTEPEIVVQILLKRFRNDGPFITKAAVRKTKATVRKMETVNMLTKEIAKLAGSSTTRRRAAAGTRASTSRKTTVIQ